VTVTALTVQPFPYTTLFRSGVGAEVRPSLQDLEDQMFKLTVRMGELNTVLADPKATEEAKKNAEKQLALIDQRMAKLELLIDLEDRKSTRLNSSHVKLSYAV